MDARGIPAVGRLCGGAVRIFRGLRRRRPGGSARRLTHPDGDLHTMRLTIPESALVVLIGPSGAGKSPFAQRHFRPTEVLSSDACRALVADAETDQAATPEAFAVLHFIAAKRLAAGRLTVIDATNVQPEARRPLITLAREYHCLAVAIVFDLPADICHSHNRDRPDRDFGLSVVHRQLQQLKRSLRGLKREGFH